MVDCCLLPFVVGCIGSLLLVLCMCSLFGVCCLLVFVRSWFVVCCLWHVSVTCLLIVASCLLLA